MVSAPKQSTSLAKQWELIRRQVGRQPHQAHLPVPSPDMTYRWNYSATTNPGDGPATDFGTTNTDSNEQSVAAIETGVKDRRAIIRTNVAVSGKSNPEYFR